MVIECSPRKRTSMDSGWVDKCIRYLSKMLRRVRPSCFCTVLTISSPLPHMKKKAPLAPSLSLPDHDDDGRK